MRKLLILLLLCLALPALATDKTAPGSSNNSKQPIAVDADTLEVYQEDQKAVFTGNVVATQGTMTVKSNKMIVYYLKKDDTAPDNAAKNAPKVSKRPAANGGDTDNAKNAIRRIDVEGNVFLTEPNQSAKSQKGYYDIQNSFINLSGDVVLTKDNNLLKGSKMDYFVDTGYSKLYSDPAPIGAKTRVRGLFVPTPKDETKQTSVK